VELTAACDTIIYYIHLTTGKKIAAPRK